MPLINYPGSILICIKSNAHFMMFTLSLNDVDVLNHGQDNLSWFVCIDISHISQQLLSHDGRLSCLPWLDQY